jgi:hypothetical protein
MDKESTQKFQLPFKEIVSRIVGLLQEVIKMIQLIAPEK